MKTYPKVPKHPKNVVISLPLAKPAPISVPIIVKENLQMFKILIFGLVVIVLFISKRYSFLCKFITKRLVII